MGIRPERAVQIRSHDTGCETVETIREAFRMAKQDKSIWKISFDAETGERVRLVFDELTEFWVYEDILESVLPCDLDEDIFVSGE